MTDKNDYSFRLTGVEHSNLAASVLRDLLDLFLEGSARSARLALEGKSNPSGGAPPWLPAAADLRISRYGEGSLRLTVSAAPLGSVAPDLFRQLPLIPGGPLPEHTAIDLLLDGLEDAVASKRDSDRLDAGLLDTLLKAGALFKQGATGLEVIGPRQRSFTLVAEHLPLIQALKDETPEPSVHRVSGTLDSLTVSSRTAILSLSDGRRLRCSFPSAELDTWKNLLGKKVVVEGPVTFRPSGTPIRMDVDYVVGAADNAEMWTKLPQGSRRATLSQGTDLAQVIGKWPGDESEEDLLHLLKGMS